MDLHNITLKSDELPPLDKTSFIASHQNISSLDYRKILISTAIIIIYSAAAVASSTSLIFIPNLETITIFIFIVSYYYGFRIGLSMMITTATIYELFASIVYGFGGPLFFFKVFAYTVTVGIAASLSQLTDNTYNQNLSKSSFCNKCGFNLYQEDKYCQKCGSPIISNRNRVESTSINENQAFATKLSRRIGFMIVGIIVTLFFDIITTFYQYFLVQNINAFILLFISGLPFIFFHELTNGIIFFFVPDYIKLMDLSNKRVFNGFE